MGAHNSTKSATKAAPKRKARQKEPHPHQDVVRGKQLQTQNDNNANRLASQVVDDHQMHNQHPTKYDNKTANGTHAVTKHTGSPTTHQHYSAGGSSPAPHHHQVPHRHSSEATGLSEDDLRHIRQHVRSFSSEDEDYLDVPAIIRSVPERPEERVNVKDRISYFKETNAPILPSRMNKPPPTTTNGHNDHSPPERTHHSPPQHSLQECEAKRDSGVADEQLGKYKRRQPPPVASKGTKSQLPRHQLPSPDGRRMSEPDIIADYQISPSTRVEDSMLPEVDYDMEKDDGEWSANGQRMNTLDYFKQVPREHSILKGFEKAKPAARTKNAKGASPQNNRFNKPKPPRSGDSRPQSMFSPTIYSSDLDIADQSENSFLSAQQDLASINNKTGQKYAIDDTAYETLSRRKKIAGQRLPIGDVDPQTERNFLKSLKRNLELKQAKKHQTDSESESDPSLSPKQLGDMRF